MEPCPHSSTSLQSNRSGRITHIPMSNADDCITCVRIDLQVHSQSITLKIKFNMLRKWYMVVAHQKHTRRFWSTSTFQPQSSQVCNNIKQPLVMYRLRKRRLEFTCLIYSSWFSATSGATSSDSTEVELFRDHDRPAWLDSCIPLRTNSMLACVSSIQRTLVLTSHSTRIE